MGFYKVFRKGAGSWIAVWVRMWCGAWRGCFKGLAPVTQASTLNSGCSSSLPQQAAQALAVASTGAFDSTARPLAPMPKLPSSTIPSLMCSLPCSSNSKHHLLPPKLAACTMLRPVLAVTGSDGERQRGPCRAQQTPAQQPHRDRGRNILASVIDGLDIAFRQPLPFQLSPWLQTSYCQQIGEFFCTYMWAIRKHRFNHREIQFLRYWAEELFFTISAEEANCSCKMGALVHCLLNCQLLF